MKLIPILIILALITLTGCAPKAGQYDNLAKCLTEKGVTMYGTEWCSHCQNQKRSFGDAFQYIDFVDCDDNLQLCVDKGVTGYPTWIIDGETYPGEQHLDKLASLSGCDI